MKRGVEDGDLRHSRAEHARRGTDAGDVVWVVERRELDELIQGAQNGLVDALRPREVLTAMDDAMTHRLDLGERSDRGLRLITHQPAGHMLDRRGQIPKRRRGAYAVSFGAERDHGLATDALDRTSGESRVRVRLDALRVGADELELE